MGIHTVLTSRLMGGCQVLNLMFMVDVDWAVAGAGNKKAATETNTKKPAIKHVHFFI
jgi:hypothetical protein